MFSPLTSAHVVRRTVATRVCSYRISKELQPGRCMLGYEFGWPEILGGASGHSPPTEQASTAPKITFRLSAGAPPQGRRLRAHDGSTVDGHHRSAVFGAFHSGVRWVSTAAVGMRLAFSPTRQGHADCLHLLLGASTDERCSVPCVVPAVFSVLCGNRRRDQPRTHGRTSRELYRPKASGPSWSPAKTSLFCPNPHQILPVPSPLLLST